MAPGETVMSTNMRLRYWYDDFRHLYQCIMLYYNIKEKNKNKCVRKQEHKENRERAVILTLSLSHDMLLTWE